MDCLETNCGFKDFQIAPEVSRHSFLAEKYNLCRLEKTVSPRIKKNFYRFYNNAFDQNKLSINIQDGFSRFGWYGMVNLYSSSGERSKAYGGLGLTYNKDYIDQAIPPLAQVFGYPRTNVQKDLLTSPLGKKIYFRLLTRQQDKEFLYKILPLGRETAIKWLLDFDILAPKEKQHFSSLLIDRSSTPLYKKNSYTDSYGFTSFTPAAELSEVKRVLASIKRTVVRSRIAEIKADQLPHIDQSRYWHRDESVFLEMRLVYCVSSPKGKYGMSVNNNDHFAFEAGQIYTWNTQEPHAVTFDPSAQKSRINLVIGVSPWFDYFPPTKSWIPNSFFGKKHPFDMLIDGDIMAGLTSLDT